MQVAVKPNNTALGSGIVHKVIFSKGLGFEEIADYNSSEDLIWEIRM